MRYWLLGALICLLIPADLLFGAPPPAKLEPEKGCYIGAYIELDDASGGDPRKFEQLTGKKHASYFRYVGYGQPFPFHWVEKVKAAGAVPHIAWEPNDGLAVVQEDDYLRGWAQAAAHAGCPIFLRYASEMNGTWMAYSGDPSLYIEKWRLVYKVFSELAPNVALVWCPFATPVATIASYYPGDEYVDWVGVNIYSVHHHDNDPAKQGGEDPCDQLRAVYDMYADRKPIQVSEYAATHYCDACKSSQVDFAIAKASALYTALIREFPRVKMVNWFSVDTVGKGLAANDYSVTDNPRVLAKYRELIADAHFLSNVEAGPAMVASLPVGPPTAKEAFPAPAAQPPETADLPEPLWHNPLKYIGPQPKTGVNLIIRGAGENGLSGLVSILADPGSQVEAKTAVFKIDGRTRLISTVQPFSYVWDTAKVEPGEHEVAVELLDARLRPAASRKVKVRIAPGAAAP